VVETAFPSPDLGSEDVDVEFGQEPELLRRCEPRDQLVLASSSLSTIVEAWKVPP
jgi:hypothetical protein